MQIFDIQTARFNMIEQQIRPWEVLDGQVLSLLSAVKRENFVPMAHKALAFVDMEIPLQAHGTQSQVMLAPRVEARFLQDAAIQPTDKVLEIGTGSGYQAAVLDRMGARVYSIETIKPLHQPAQSLLKHLNCRAKLFVGDGSLGLPSFAPFDRILVTAASPSVPSALQNQLKVGGHLVIPVGTLEEQTMLKITRLSEVAFSTQSYPGFRFVPLTGAEGWPG